MLCSVSAGYGYLIAGDHAGENLESFGLSERLLLRSFSEGFPYHPRGRPDETGAREWDNTDWTSDHHMAGSQVDQPG